MRDRGAPLLVLAALMATAAACAGADPNTPASGDAAGTGSSAQRWRPLDDASLSRTEVGAGRVGRFIYVVGGFLSPTETVNSVERYDVRNDAWTQIAPMPIAVNHPAVTSHRGRLYVYGGYTDSSFGPVTGALQRFDPTTGGWTLLPPSPTPRAAAALAAVHGRLLAIGGTANGEPLRRLEIFDLGQASWSGGRSMRVAREHLAATAAAGDVYVLGGRVDGKNLRTVERYDPGLHRWKRMPAMEIARSGIAAATVKGRPVVFGGEELTPGGHTIRQVELFDPEARRWHRLPGMRTPRHGLGGAALGRRVYALEGGPAPGFAFSSAVEFLDVPRRLLR